MACPGGCLNGGGQIQPTKKVDENQKSDFTAVKERLSLVDKVFHDRPVLSPVVNKKIERLYKEWLGNTPFGPIARVHLHTHYHAIPKVQDGLFEKW